MSEATSNTQGTLYVVGLGPGGGEGMTQVARDALEACDVIFGYTTYIKLIEQEFAHKPLRSTGMRKEVERCRLALEEAATGQTVAMVCSGDPGVFAMAGLCYELTEEIPGVEVKVVPGVTAATAGAAVLGAPLIHDFAVISLSDLLTPWEVIEKRLEAAALADFCICLYNPSSHKRHDYLQRACDILLRHRNPANVCGIARNIGRPGEEGIVCTLGELRNTQVDMFSTVFIGNSSTRIMDGKMVTPRGYLQRGDGKGASTEAASASEHGSAPAPCSGEADLPAVLVFGGTSEGREIIEWLASLGTCNVVACQATAYGSSLLPDSPRVTALTERLDEQAMVDLMTSKPFACVVDATHPYAAIVSANAAAAAEHVGLPLVRVARAGVDAESVEPFIHAVADVIEAAELAASMEGNILLTTGSKDLAAFTSAIPDASERVFARILPVRDSLDHALELGIPVKNIIAMQGPFTQNLNEALITSFDIRIMITKASGTAGGFEEKVEAARTCGIELIVIEPPSDDAGVALARAQELIKERIGL